MEKKLYYGLLRAFLAAAFIIVSSSTVSAQRFETKKVYLSGYGEPTKTIKIEPIAKFSIKKANRCSWASYEELNSAVKISVTANTSKKSRSCSFVLLDETKTPVDTLEVVQEGKVSAKPSKAATSSSRSSGGQCAAITKKGTRCSRKASAGSRYCWQHN